MIKKYMNKTQIKEAKQWKKGSVRNGILACNRMTLKQCHEDLQFSKRHDIEYYNRIMNLGAIKNE